MEANGKSRLAVLRPAHQRSPTEIEKTEQSRFMVTLLFDKVCQRNVLICGRRFTSKHDKTGKKKHDRIKFQHLKS